MTCAGGALAAFTCEPAYLMSPDTCAEQTVVTLETEAAVPACCDADACSCTGAAVPLADAEASCAAVGARLCSSDEIAGGGCESGSASAGCGGPVWTRSRFPCSEACVAGFVDVCATPEVAGGTDPKEAYRACRRALDTSAGSAWDQAGA